MSRVAMSPSVSDGGMDGESSAVRRLDRGAVACCVGARGGVTEAPKYAHSQSRAPARVLGWV